MNQEETNNVGGRPTKYKPEFSRLAYQMALLGATDIQMAEAFDISESTIYEWKKIRRFSEALRKGKIEADSKVAQALYKRALGFTYNETTFEKIDGKANLQITTANEIVTVDAYKKKVVTKYLPPDTGAAMSWLKNRQKELWRDKQVIEFEKMSDEDLDKIIEGLKKTKPV
jgi:hypothetical protein